MSSAWCVASTGLWLFLFCITCSGPTSVVTAESSFGNITVEYDPDIIKLDDESTKIVNCNFSVLLDGLEVSVTSENTDIFEVVKHGDVATGDVGSILNVTIRGRFLGYSKLVLQLSREGEVLFRDERQVVVVRKETAIQTVFQMFVTVIVAVNYINMGCQLDLKLVWSGLKKPIGPLIGFCCQFLFMPLLSFGIGLWLLQQDTMRLGLFLLGCSPGGNSSNLWTLMFDGDLPLSITMTFVSTIAAIGMMPLWMSILGSKITKSLQSIEIPYLNVFTSLITVMAPLIIGSIIRHFRPAWAEKSRKIIKPVSFIIIIGIIGMSFFTNTYIFQLITWRTMVSGMLVAWSGYIFGGLTAFLLRLPRKQIIAIAIETAFQNGTLSIVIVMTAFPQPDADLSMIPVVCQLMVQSLPLVFILLMLKGPGKIKKCLGRSDETEIIAESEMVKEDPTKGKENFAFQLEEVKSEQKY